MARYRKIDVRIWGDAKFRALTPIHPSGQALWLYLLTTPKTTSIPGLICGGQAAMAEALRWPLEAFREAFALVFVQGMAEADWEARLVWIPKAIEHNVPESPNVIRSWRIHWDETPECALKLKVWQHLKAFMEGLGEGFQRAFDEACPKPSAKAMANQEQEQEQDQKKKLLRGADEAPAPAPQASPVVVVLPCVGRGLKEYPVTEAQLAAYHSAYPGVDLRLQLHKARAWLEANPAKRKTHRGVPRFLVGWFERAQNSNRNGLPKVDDYEERMRRLRDETERQLTDANGRNGGVAGEASAGDPPARDVPEAAKALQATVGKFLGAGGETWGLQDGAALELGAERGGAKAARPLCQPGNDPGGDGPAGGLPF